MPNNSKTYILDDQWTDKDALDFIPLTGSLENSVIDTRIWGCERAP